MFHVADGRSRADMDFDERMNEIALRQRIQEGRAFQPQQPWMASGIVGKFITTEEDKERANLKLLLLEDV